MWPRTNHSKVRPKVKVIADIQTDQKLFAPEYPVTEGIQ